VTNSPQSQKDIGTRRPLIIQMMNNPSKEYPSCRFRKEANANGISEGFEEKETAVQDLVQEIVRRTNEKAGSGPDKVSPIPIILRVEYCYSANLTIYDTPVLP
jgi:hypothetical protein